MRVLVTGGKGGLGRDVVSGLREAGHDVLVATRNPSADGEVGFDLSGVVPNLTGVDTVVHLATQPSNVDKEISGSKALFDEARRAGVGHVVFMSIVGIDEHPFPYYRAKVGVERALIESGVPWTIFRSTQFHGFIPRIVDTVAKAGLVALPSGVAVQPIDRATVTSRLVDLVEAAPSGWVPDLGGPEVLDLHQMARAYLRATGRRTPVVRMPIGGRVVDAFRRGLHHSPNRDLDGRTYAEYLSTLSKRRDPAGRLLRLTGAGLMFTVVVMMIAPGVFHSEFAGFGVLNTHFIRDAATFGVPMAAALWMSASRRSWRKPVLALGLIQNGLHIVNHMVDVGASEPGWHGPMNLALLVVFEYFMWLAWRIEGRVRSDDVRVKVAA